MPNSASAEKRLRQNLTRRQSNREIRSRLRTSIRRVRDAVSEGRDDIQELFKVAQKRLDQAAAKNLIHKNAAARSKSRLSRLVKVASASRDSDMKVESIVRGSQARMPLKGKPNSKSSRVEYRMMTPSDFGDEYIGVPPFERIVHSEDEHRSTLSVFSWPESRIICLEIDSLAKSSHDALRDLLTIADEETWKAGRITLLEPKSTTKNNEVDWLLSGQPSRYIDATFDSTQIRRDNLDYVIEQLEANHRSTAILSGAVGDIRLIVDRDGERRICAVFWNRDGVRRHLLDVFHYYHEASSDSSVSRLVREAITAVHKQIAA